MIKRLSLGDKPSKRGMLQSFIDHGLHSQPSARRLVFNCMFVPPSSFFIPPGLASALVPAPVTPALNEYIITNSSAAI